MWPAVGRCPPDTRRRCRTASSVVRRRRTGPRARRQRSPPHAEFADAAWSHARHGALPRTPRRACARLRADALGRLDGCRLVTLRSARSRTEPMLEALRDLGRLVQRADFGCGCWRRAAHARLAALAPRFCSRRRSAPRMSRSTLRSGASRLDQLTSRPSRSERRRASPSDARRATASSFTSASIGPKRACSSVERGGPVRARCARRGLEARGAPSSAAWAAPRSSSASAMQTRAPSSAQQPRRLRPCAPRRTRHDRRACPRAVACLPPRRSGRDAPSGNGGAMKLDIFSELQKAKPWPPGEPREAGDRRGDRAGEARGRAGLRRLVERRAPRRGRVQLQLDARVHPGGAGPAHEAAALRALGHPGAVQDQPPAARGGARRLRRPGDGRAHGGRPRALGRHGVDRLRRGPGHLARAAPRGAAHAAAHVDGALLQVGERAALASRSATWCRSRSRSRTRRSGRPARAPTPSRWRASWASARSPPRCSRRSRRWRSSSASTGRASRNASRRATS